MTARKIMKPNTNTEAAGTVQTTSDQAVAPAATCSAFRFSFSATYPKDHDRCGGTFLEGDLEVDDLDDLPEAALAIFKGAVADWDMTGQTEIRFSILLIDLTHAGANRRRNEANKPSQINRLPLRT